MSKQIISFKNALSGVWSTIKNESHMRFHIVAAFYVILFSFFYDFSMLQWALIIIVIGAVMALEVLNTSIEELCNLCADRYEPLVKFAKDAAAGAVLVMSLAAAAVAFIFYWDIGVFISIFKYFSGNISMLCLFAATAVFSVIFILLGPVGIKNTVLNMKFKIKGK